MIENNDGEFLTLKIGKFELKNVDAHMQFPINLMKAFSDCLVWGTGIAHISSDSSECDYNLILGGIAPRSSVCVHRFGDKELCILEVSKVEELAKELLSDLKRDSDFWIGKRSRRIWIGERSKRRIATPVRRSINRSRKEIAKWIKVLEKNIKDYEQLR